MVLVCSYQANVFLRYRLRFRSPTTVVNRQLFTSKQRLLLAVRGSSCNMLWRDLCISAGLLGVCLVADGHLNLLSRLLLQWASRCCRVLNLLMIIVSSAAALIAWIG